jgi:hypothetical protein
MVRLRYERRYGESQGDEPQGGEPPGSQPFWPQADHRLFDVPPPLAGPISSWYRDRGWEVIEEPI